jgi:hypothetical protein
MFRHVERVHHLGGYRLALQFDNGVAKEVDLEQHLVGEVFTPLLNPDLFRQVRLNANTGTIEWPNGADFAPEFLYEIGHDVQQVA